jgi:hypothetical protein
MGEREEICEEKYEDVPFGHGTFQLLFYFILSRRTLDAIVNIYFLLAGYWI